MPKFVDSKELTTLGPLPVAQRGNDLVVVDTADDLDPQVGIELLEVGDNRVDDLQLVTGVADPQC